jgi:competence protein ComEC
VQQSLGPSAVAWPIRGERLASLLAALARHFEEERTRWLLWTPVALGSGSAVLFALPNQPTDMAAGVAAVLGIASALGAFHARVSAARAAQALLLALAIACLGFALAQARIRLVAAPILERAGVYDVDGRVIDLAPLARGARVLLDEVRLVGVAPDRTPATLRINLRRTPPGLLPGDRIAVRARLQRPMMPALPGAFDFARQAWFERLGAVGFALGTAVREAAPDDAGGLAVAELRAVVAQRISQANPGTAGAMAAALTAGVRAGIDQATWRDMQVSGLAHILSVSGLHMAMVAGSVFLVCRWLLALIPPLALRIPVKKPAAGLALLAAAFYLVLSGASVPAQRSFLMTAVALLAVMVDRNPFSLRLLAWAAVVVLLLRPEAVVGASFQLSFAAVLALMVAYETWRGRGERDAPEPGALASAWRYLLGVAATTLVAGAATTPFAAFHFQTIPTYGMLANLVAVPLTTFVVMPAGMAGMLLMPVGLEGPFFHAMTVGCEAVLWIARVVAGLPGASLLVHQWPGSALALLAVGALWVGLWQRSWRWWGLLPVVVAAGLVVLFRPPDLLVDPDMDMAAIRDEAGAVTLLEWRRDRMIRDSWLRHLGVARAEPPPAPGTGSSRGIACDEAGCVVAIGGARISLARAISAAVEDCGLVDLVIARLGPVRCRGANLIGPRQLRDSGGLAIRYRGGDLTVETVQGRRGRWPWSMR